MRFLSIIKKSVSKKKKYFALLLAIFLISFFLFSALQTYLSLKKLQAFDFAQSAKYAQNGLLFPHAANVITFRSVPILTAWEATIKQILLTQTVLDEGSLFISSALQPNSHYETSPEEETQYHFYSSLENFNQNLDFLIQQTEKSWLLQKALPLERKQSLEKLASLNQDLSLLTRHFFTGKRTYLLPLQNSQEIRATGGFMGSYAKITIDNGTIQEFSIEDIYQPDGQFKGFVEPPLGVKEYLSSGNGLRLPDSNWNPDFPSSAQEILNFFAQGGEKNIDGLISINLSVAENILAVTGDIPLPDYDQVVTHENLAQVARADRDEFFPGSQQKPNFLNALLKQLTIRFQALPDSQKKEILEQLFVEIPSKNIQFYSNTPEIQDLFQKYHLSGGMSHSQEESSTVSPQYLYLVESNVGINKANKKIYREVDIDITDTTAKISINFTNKNNQTSLSSFLNTSSSNQQNTLNYANYQRMFVLPDVEINSITVDGSELSHWDETVIISASGEYFKQIGFLIFIPEKSSVQAYMELTFPEPFSLNPQLAIQKQSGLPPTPYSIQYGTAQKNLLLEKDEAISF